MTLCSRLVPLGLAFPGSLPLLHGLLVLGFADGGGTVLRQKLWDTMEGDKCHC